MSFQEYYKHYLTLHQNKTNRHLHVFGQLATLAYMGYIVHGGWWWWLLLSPFVIYPFAWTGHFFFEKNKPAAFNHPLWAKICDWLMLKDILKGKLK